MEGNTVAAVEGEVDGYRWPAPTAAGSSHASSSQLSARDIAPGTSDEQSPLLSRKTSGRSDDDEHSSHYDGREFRHLPWWKRPSIFWIIPPLFPFTLAFGGVAVPKLNLILTLICQNYLSDRATKDPSFTYLPVLFGEKNPQCQIPEVQALVSNFQLVLNLVSGGLSALASPKLGALSDKYGRVRIVSLCALGILIGEVITLGVAARPDIFHVNLLLAAAFFDGLFGSVTSTLALTQSYATDCAPPARRNVAFGYFHGILFSGIAFGPLGAGYLIELTGSVLPVFYAVIGCHLFFLLCTLLIIPESLSEERRRQNRAKQAVKSTENGELNRWITRLNPLKLLQPLSILFPLADKTNYRSTTTDEGRRLRHAQRNLIILSAIDASMFGVAMGAMYVLILYAEYMFGWGNFESSIFVSITSFVRVLALVIILPTVTRLVRGPQSALNQTNTGSDKLDLIILRISIFMDMLGYIGYSAVRTGPLLMLSGAVAATGAMGSPTLQSSLTKHIPPSRTGQLLGALGLLHALARVVAPAIFNLMYSLTVGTFPQTVFVCLSGLLFLAFAMSFFLKPHVYIDSSNLPTGPETRHEANEETR